VTFSFGGSTPGPSREGVEPLDQNPRPIWAPSAAPAPAVWGGHGAAIGARVPSKAKEEAVRCLKRYIAREVYSHLPIEDLALDSP